MARVSRALLMMRMTSMWRCASAASVGFVRMLRVLEERADDDVGRRPLGDLVMEQSLALVLLADALEAGVPYAVTPSRAPSFRPGVALGLRGAP